jgi:acetolactate synthase-1/2/3 large subunit
MWMARMFRCEFPNTCLISNGFASMGIAVPGAIAAKLVYPERNIVAVTGDAGFLMNSQEIETAMRCKLPIVILIWNDGGYGLIEWKQLNQFKRSSHIKFGNPDFVMYAESFGCKGYRVERTEDLPAILEEALSNDTVSWYVRSNDRRGYQAGRVQSCCRSWQGHRAAHPPAQLQHPGGHQYRPLPALHHP